MVIIRNISEMFKHFLKDKGVASLHVTRTCEVDD